MQGIFGAGEEDEVVSVGQDISVLWNDRDWFFGMDVALFLMDQTMSSMQRLKRMALRGHPCFTPDRIGMGSVDSVEVRMVVVAPMYTLVMRETRESGMPMCWRVVLMAEWGMLLKALHKSSQAT